MSLEESVSSPATKCQQWILFFLFGELPLEDKESKKKKGQVRAWLEVIPLQYRRFVLQKCNDPAQELDFKRCMSITLGDICYRLGVALFIGRPFLVFRMYNASHHVMPLPLLTVGVLEREVTSEFGKQIRAYSLFQEEKKRCSSETLSVALSVWHEKIGRKLTFQYLSDSCHLQQGNQKTWMYYYSTGQTNILMPGLYAL